MNGVGHQTSILDVGGSPCVGVLGSVQVSNVPVGRTCGLRFATKIRCCH